MFNNSKVQRIIIKIKLSSLLINTHECVSCFSKGKQYIRVRTMYYTMSQQL